MTLAELKALIDTNIPNNSTGLITPAKERQVLKAIADFVVGSIGEVETVDFVYDPGYSYSIDEPVISSGAWYLSLADDNIGNTPASSPASWEPINAQSDQISLYTPNTVYLGLLSLVIKDAGLYYLDRDLVGDFPFVSTDFETELAAGEWKILQPEEEGLPGTPLPTVARWIVSPVIQWTGEGYIYAISESVYELPGIAAPITAPATTKTLTVADDDYDRFSLFVWNELGVVGIIDGTPAMDPIIPAVDDPFTQITGPSFVLVKAGTTEPDPILTFTTTIYNENTEWTGAAVGCNADFDNATPVFKGAKSVNVSAIAVNDYIEFTASEDFNPKLFDSLGLQIYLKAAFPASNQNIGIRFFSLSNQAVSSEVAMTLDKNLVSAWQLAGTNISRFTFTTDTPAARKIRLRWTRGTVDFAGFFLDLIQLQGGIAPPDLVGTVVLTGQVTGSGQTGTPIQTTISEKAISDQQEVTPEADDHLLVRTGAGLLRKTKISELGFQTNNIVKVEYINRSELSGTGTLEEQIAEYIAANRTIILDQTTSKINIVLKDDLA